MSMSKFATYAEYQDSIKPIDKAIDKTALLDRITAMNAELDAEAQQAKDAAMWRAFCKASPCEALVFQARLRDRQEAKEQ